jgi:predicted DNA-binding transcriptional regulator YafY
MKTKAKMKKSERLNQELIYLSGKYSFGLAELMRAFGISKRTALRDVAELSALGLPVFTEAGRYGGYRVLKHEPLVPVYFSADETAAIFFALKSLELLSATPFEANYDQVREKLLKTLPEAQQREISDMLAVLGFVGTPPVAEVPDLRLILQAILERKVLAARDAQHGDAEVQLQFYDIFYRNGVWFASAWDFKGARWGTFRCDALSALTEIKNIKSHTRRTLTALRAAYDATFYAISFRCQLTDFGREQFLKNHYPGMRLDAENGDMIGGYNAADETYMVNYLTGFGNAAKVVAPARLKNAVLMNLKTIVASYDSDA